ncbi:exodeoxyribonuclease VII small subunit [Propioniciclava tarda]|uniref:Exodeoxyribonuclease 7 small subunit n=1 Tax=Propioniciclava tarda TaxID=433330 RepID=A0A4Q9KLB7_PROTD|nr:exodeoxyribonuclease VII small subunit [Propioniciclava tarda]TBT94449.1 exodeoxyribonuclease VII small subunit [Propioniciclava tarda]SMO70231.1 Exodeoxyribonuclease VII small subunit [Propioniciclava tarda]
MSTPKQATELSYEEARDQLVGVVRELESGSVPLSEAMRLWERGEVLAAICQRWLDGARATIERAKSVQAG